MAKSQAQYLEEARNKGYDGDVEPGTIMAVDGHPFIYLANGKRPYFKEQDGQIVIL